MCGRYAVFLEEENQEMRRIIKEINERFPAAAKDMKTGDICPTDKAPVLISQQGISTPTVFKWGFPGFKPKSPVIINARSETLDQRPMFKNILHKKRCIVPVSAFYEWKKTENGKEKYLIRSPENKLLYIAGLYDDFIDKNGQPFTAYVILTRDADEQMAPIHDRMPVVLDDNDSDEWINRDKKIDEILNQHPSPLLYENKSA